MHLETARLIICEFTPDMAEAVHKNSLDEDTRRFVPDEVFETVEAAAETLAFLMESYGMADRPQVYPVLLKTGENIGYVQLVPIDEGLEIGYHIAKPHTGRGYATEAVGALLAYAKPEIIWGICLSENAASKRVMEKCAFEKVFEGEGQYQGKMRQIARYVWRRKGQA